MKFYVFISLALLALTVHGETPRFPDGYPPGRPDADYGEYHTAYRSPKARELGDLVESLDRKVHGLAQAASHDEVTQAESLYVLERLNLHLFQEIANAGPQELTSFERQALAEHARRLLGVCRSHGERLYKTMVARVDVALPGPNGKQIRVENTPDGIELYDQNCRGAPCGTAEEKAAFYQKKKKEFLDAGGSMDELHVLSPEKIAKKPLIRFEYVERPNGEIWVTEGNAGHVLLAGGGPVRAAGQLIIVNSLQGPIILVMLSNGSGSYKPDLSSIRKFKPRLAASLGVPLGSIMVVAGVPLHNQPVSVLLKARGTDKATIAERLDDLERMVEEALRDPKGFFKTQSCSSKWSLVGGP